MPSKDEPKKRGAKGGIKHQPGRGHDNKSASARKKRFQRKAARKRQAQEQDARRQWEIGDHLSDEQKRLRPELQPTLPRPEHGD
jgi:hypothetical protein